MEMRIAGKSRIWANVLAVAFALTLSGCAHQYGAAPHPPAAWAKEVVTTADWGESDTGPMDPTIPPYDPRTAAGPGDQIKARFRGTDRKAAKISISNASLENDMTIAELAGTVVDDDEMKNHDPPISKASSSDRVEEEERSVKVRGWIYAIKYEDDQDWHLIVGSDPDGDSPTYFNCEVSGLPSRNASAYDKLLQVRQSLAEILVDDLPGPSAYTKYKTPIPVYIEGSLFFDVDHAAGVVGPTGMRPETAWEIHPITKIAYRPD